MRTKTRETAEDFHGTTVTDPYRSLEDPLSAETIRWTEEQNKLTTDYLNNFPKRKQIKEHITKMMDFPKYTVPQFVNGSYYFHANSGLHNQPIFYRSKSLKQNEREIVLDPNRLSEEGTAALMSTTFSKDGTKMAYTIARNGSDRCIIKIKNLKTGNDYPETIKLNVNSTLAWSEDNNGFYYSNYPNEKDKSDISPSFYNQILYHQVGTEQTEDTIVFQDPTQKELCYEPFISENNEYLILKAHIPTQMKSNIYYRKLANNDDAFTKLFDHPENNYLFISSKDETFYFFTDDRASNGRVIAININKPAREHWQEIIPEQDETIISVVKIGDYFVATVLNNVNGQVKIFNENGALYRDVPLSGQLTITGVAQAKAKDELLIGYTSFLEPTQIVKYNLKSDQLEFIFKVKSPVNTNDYETKQITYMSTDGTKIPMYLTHTKGLKLTGDHPVLLFAYGGYNLNQTPLFNPAIMTWIQSGGVYAVANIRGGGEFGRDWHEGGMFENKQQVFDDFFAAAEWLIAEKYTNSNKLAIMGRSNGGLLVGVSILQRPELFGAALCLVPVTDMLRFQHYTSGRLWTTEFGHAEKNAADFENMYTYSPLHNVKAGAKYPPTLITTADYDDRVIPMHAKKFVATLKEKQANPENTFFREEKNAGHGDGKPTSKTIQAETDLYTFLFKELGVVVKA